MVSKIVKILSMILILVVTFLYVCHFSFSGLFNEFTYSFTSLAYLTIDMGRFPVNLLHKNVNPNTIEHNLAWFLYSPRQGIVALLSILSLVSGISPLALNYAPINALIRAVIIYALLNRATKSHSISLFGVIITEIDPIILRSSSTVFAHSFAYTSFALFILILFKLIRDSHAWKYILLLYLSFISTVFSHYAFTLWEIMTVFVVGLLCIAVTKDYSMMRIFVIMTVLWIFIDPVIYSQINPLLLGHGGFRHFISYLWETILGETHSQPGIQFNVFFRGIPGRLYTYSGMALYVITLALVIIYIIIKSREIIVRRDKAELSSFPTNLIISFIVAAVVDTLIYLQKGTVSFKAFLYLFLPIIPLILFQLCNSCGNNRHAKRFVVVSILILFILLTKSVSYCYVYPSVGVTPEISGVASITEYQNSNIISDLFYAEKLTQIHVMNKHYHKLHFMFFTESTIRYLYDLNAPRDYLYKNSISIVVLSVLDFKKGVPANGWMVYPPLDDPAFIMANDMSLVGQFGDNYVILVHSKNIRT